jgi:hypothetical protein
MFVYLAARGIRASWLRHSRHAEVDLVVHQMFAWPARVAATAAQAMEIGRSYADRVCMEPASGMHAENSCSLKMPTGAVRGD